MGDFLKTLKCITSVSSYKHTDFKKASFQNQAKFNKRMFACNTLTHQAMYLKIKFCSKGIRFINCIY